VHEQRRIKKVLNMDIKVKRPKGIPYLLTNYFVVVAAIIIVVVVVVVVIIIMLYSIILFPEDFKFIMWIFSEIKTKPHEVKSV
jgi:membrane protein YdbS with pleckstrin-like domain